MLGVDTASVLNGSALNGLKGAGVGAVGRYLGRMGATEANLIRAYGLDIFGVLETSGTSGYGGYQTGVNEMNAAIHGTRIAGGPLSGIVLWVGAFDFDARNPAAAQGYINGAVDTAHANGYLAGFYGPWGLALNTHGWDAWWQTMSTGFWLNRYTAAADISQRFPQPYFGGEQFDYDDIHNPARGGLWSQRGAGPIPAPAPVDPNKEDERMGSFVLHVPPGGDNGEPVFVPFPKQGPKIAAQWYGFAVDSTKDPNAVQMVRLALGGRNKGWRPPLATAGGWGPFDVAVGASYIGWIAALDDDGISVLPYAFPGHENMGVTVHMTWQLA